jgi:ABC-type polysaccharide/polyol phosphate transport system ATPase subunit
MVMVAHDLETILEMCTRVVWMAHGQVVMNGEPEQVVRAYVDFVLAEQAAARPNEAGGPPAAAA